MIHSSRHTLTYSLSLLVVCITATLGQAASATSPVVISFPENQPSDANVVNDNFLGLSIELSAFGYLWGQNASTLPQAMQNYLSSIRKRMSSPLRVRIGGNSMDSSTYVPSQSEAVEQITSSTTYNDVPTNFGSELFDVMNAMADKVGEMDFILTLEMRNPDFSNDVLLAEDATQKLGQRLDLFMLGNEPDEYAAQNIRPGYTIMDYVTEVGELMSNLSSSSQGNLLSTPRAGAPTVCCGPWSLEDVLNAGLINDKLKYVTLQHYPMSVCPGAGSDASNISYYLSHANVAPYLLFEQSGMQIARSHNIPVLLTEFNSASCGGSPAVGPTFGAALWATDVALSAAALNFGGVFIHTKDFGAVYNMFEPSSPNTSTSDPWTTRPIFYSELIVAEALSNNSVVVDLNLDNSTTDSAATIAGYAVYSNGSRQKLLFINFANSSTGGSDTSRSFVIPENLSSAMEVKYFLAPTVTEQEDVSWAGQTVSGDGSLVGISNSTIQPCASGCLVTVPGPGLALVLLNPSNQTSSSVTTSASGSSSTSNKATSESIGTRTVFHFLGQSGLYFIPVISTLFSLIYTAL